MKIQIVKQTDEKLSESDSLAVRGYLLGGVDGATDDDKRAWRLFLSALASAGSGEVFTLDINYTRQAWFHRLHFKIILRVFEAQSSFKKIDRFRDWLKVGAGFVDWVEDHPIPKSINYLECDELTMRQFHSDCVDFLRSDRALKELWPDLTLLVASQCIEALLQPFEE